MRILTLALALSIVVTGCFTYVPLDGEPGPDRGDAVQVELTDRGHERLRPITGSANPRARGTVIDSTPDSLRLSVEFRGFSSSLDGDAMRRDVSIPRGEIEAVSLRRLSMARSGFLIGAGTVATFLLLRALGGTSSGDFPTPPPPAI